MINPDGNAVIDVQFDELADMEGGVAPAKLGGKAGFVTLAGSWLIAPQYDHCYRFFGRLAVVGKGDVCSYIRRSGLPVWTSLPWAAAQAPPYYP